MPTMNPETSPPHVQPPRHPTKSNHLSLQQIAAHIGQAVAEQRRSIAQAHSSRLYATDLDEFLDIVGHQSVNTNHSQPHGAQR